jgi:osmoprotectant transport system permease protein
MTAKAKGIIVLIVLIIVGIGLLVPVFLNLESGDQLSAGFDSEFLVRQDGYPGLVETYNFRFAKEPRHMDPGLMYRAVADGGVDVICGFATDGRIPAYDLVMLEDNKDFFPPYHAAPLIRQETLEEHPGLDTLLNELSEKLPDSVMQQLNYEVDEENRSPREVAAEFLTSEGLVGDDVEGGPEVGGAGIPVRIGGKNFTEQEVLGEIMAQLIEERTDIPVERKLNLGGTMICFNALQAGDLDLYAEYTGTGLVSILKLDAINDAEVAYETVRREFTEKYDLLWLEPFGFNNTYTLTMRKEQAQELGIETISDLSEYVRENES